MGNGLIATRLVHGDLYVRHLLVNEQMELCGVIDWGDVHIGDPAEDLAIAHSFLRPPDHGRFLAEYGEVDTATWTLARFRALQHSAMLAVYAHEFHDGTLLREPVTALRSIARHAARPWA